MHAQRRLGSGSSKSKKIAQNDAKHGLSSRSLTSKASVQQARRNLVRAYAFVGIVSVEICWPNISSNCILF